MGASLLAFARMLLVLGLITGALLLFARLAKKRQLGSGLWQGGRTQGEIEVISRRSLGQHVSLLVVRVCGRTFLIGQGNDKITMLTELEVSELSKSGSAIAGSEHSDQILTPGTVPGSVGISPGAWDAFIDRLREMTVRH